MIMGCSILEWDLVKGFDWKYESFEWNKALSNIKKIKDKQESSAEDYAPR